MADVVLLSGALRPVLTAVREAERMQQQRAMLLQLAALPGARQEDWAYFHTAGLTATAELRTLSMVTFGVGPAHWSSIQARRRSSFSHPPHRPAQARPAGRTTSALR